jgi:hypothetical protein
VPAVFEKGLDILPLEKIAFGVQEVAKRLQFLLELGRIEDDRFQHRGH